MRAQLLTAARPRDLVDTVRHLTLLQLDPTAAVAPNADLVAWSRLGSAYSPDDLRGALDARALVEFQATIRHTDHVPLMRAAMQAWPARAWHHTLAEWLQANDRCRRDVLARLAQDGPLLSRDLPDTCVVPWQSSGWTDNKNITKLLEILAAQGHVAISGRRGRERLWDLAERVYPPSPDVPSLERATAIRDERRLHALGIARSTGTEVPIEIYTVGEAGEAAEVDGVPGTWRVDPAYLDGAPFRGRAALLSPFDRLVHDRTRLAELFEYEYTLEMYKPASARRWGYFALPVLYGDRLIGKLDATADRRAGVLRVNATHQDTPWSPTATRAVQREISALARWLGLDEAR